MLLPLLGVTWILGIFTVNDNTTLFAWLFTIINSLQVNIIFYNNYSHQLLIDACASEHAYNPVIHKLCVCLFVHNTRTAGSIHLFLPCCEIRQGVNHCICEILRIWNIVKLDSPTMHVVYTYISVIHDVCTCFRCGTAPEQGQHGTPCASRCRGAV